MEPVFVVMLPFDQFSMIKNPAAYELVDNNSLYQSVSAIAAHRSCT